jgi:hypothetical protein
MNGKGSTPRPQSVDREEFDRRWDRAFGKSPATPKAECDRTELEASFMGLSRTLANVRRPVSDLISADFARGERELAILKDLAGPVEPEGRRYTFNPQPEEPCPKA